MSGWRKCDTCRKVRSTDEYGGGATTCQDCLTAPAPRRRAAPVTRTASPRASTPAPTHSAPAAAGPRQPLLGTIGNGDLEVRERRARRAALEQLGESHPEELTLLLRDTRAAEGLRAMGNATTPTEGDAAADVPAEAGPAES